MTAKSKADLLADILRLIPNNQEALISPMDVRQNLIDIIDSLFGGSLPGGSDVLNELRFRQTEGGWVAVNTTQVRYLVLTRTNAYADIAEVLNFALNVENVTDYPPIAYSPNPRAGSTPGFASVREMPLDGNAFAFNFRNYAVVENDSGYDITNVWPPNSTPPFCSFLVPTATGWAPDYTIEETLNYWGEVATSRIYSVATGNLTLTRSALSIRGVPYDWLIFQLEGDRPLYIDIADPNREDTDLSRRYIQAMYVAPLVPATFADLR